MLDKSEALKANTRCFRIEKCTPLKTYLRVIFLYAISHYYITINTSYNLG